MRFTTWLDGLKVAPRNRRARRALSPRSRHPRPRCSLSVERLEDRTVPTFAAPVHYDVGVNPQAVVVGDFNNDHILDLAVVNFGTNAVSVLRGVGNGTFLPSVDSATGNGPLSLAVGDFNDDGKLDIATANLYDVSVLLGNNDGAFAAPTSIGLGSNPQSVAVGDFNADGTLDLGVTSNVYNSGFWGGPYNNYWYPGYYTAYANVLLGTGAGDGSFAAPITSWAGYGFHTSAAVGDFIGDGALDFAAANYDSWAVTVMEGDGLGNLYGPYDYSAGYGPWSLAAGNLNGDSRTDLVTANRYGNDVSVLLGSDGGGFNAPQNYAVGSEPVSVVLGDFNHDDNLDIATANYSSNDVSVLRGHSNGYFWPAVNSDAGANPASVAAGRFDGDGRLDAATANASANGASVLINDLSWPPPPPPTVSINDVTVWEGNTGTVDATFTVSLSYVSDVDVTVHYQMAPITATAPSDYTFASADVIIPAGQTSMPVTVAVSGDRVAESTETFAVNLGAPVNATIGDGQGIGTILDDEPRISINDVTVTEGNTGSVNATFTVTLSALYDVDVTVHYDTANGTATAGSDYTAGSGTVTILAGHYSQTFTVAVLGDRLAESTETYFVNLSSPVNAGISDGQGVGTILDNEPRISINDVTVTEGNTGSVNATFTVTLSALYDVDVTVHYDTTNGTATAGSDYTAGSGTVTILAGHSSQTFTVAVLGDRLAESTETYFVNLSSPVNAGISDGQGVGTTLDNEPRISINNVSKKEGNGNTTQFIFTVTLSAAYDQAVTVNYATANGSATAGSDYQAKNGTLTFAPGVTSMTITILVIGEKAKEADETFFVSLSGASNNAIISGAQGIGTILDDDTHGK